MDLSTRVGFFLIGFGTPNLEVKINILRHNLQTLKARNLKGMVAAVDLYIYCYTPREAKEALEHPSMRLLMTEALSNTYIVEKKGIVGEFIHHEVSKEYAKYNYIVLLLDDILLPNNFDLGRMVWVYNREHLDILALPLTQDSPYNYKFMLQREDLRREGFTYRQTNFAELFFYLMSTDNFGRKYLPFITHETKWCWGIDLALHNYGLKMGLMECFPVKHFFKGVSYNTNLPDPLHELNVQTAHLHKIKRKINFRRAAF
jgi:hypothetical protein